MISWENLFQLTPYRVWYSSTRAAEHRQPTSSQWAISPVCLESWTKGIYYFVACIGFTHTRTHTHTHTHTQNGIQRQTWMGSFCDSGCHSLLCS